MTASRHNAATILAGIGLGAAIAFAAGRAFPDALARLEGWILDGFLASLGGLFVC